VRSYQYRFHPPESAGFERCIGFAWCSGCRIYSGNMVYVPRKRVLVDALASLPADDRDQLLRKEAALVDYLDRRDLDRAGRAPARTVAERSAGGDVGPG
jgi:hypothetical protein